MYVRESSVWSVFGGVCWVPSGGNRVGFGLRDGVVWACWGANGVWNWEYIAVGGL